MKEKINNILMKLLNGDLCVGDASNELEAIKVNHTKSLEDEFECDILV